MDDNVFHDLFAFVATLLGAVIMRYVFFLRATPFPLRTWGGLYMSWSCAKHSLSIRTLPRTSSFSKVARLACTLFTLCDPFFGRQFSEHSALLYRKNNKILLRMGDTTPSFLETFLTSLSIVAVYVRCTYKAAVPCFCLHSYNHSSEYGFIFLLIETDFIETKGTMKAGRDSLVAVCDFSLQHTIRLYLFFVAWDWTLYSYVRGTSNKYQLLWCLLM